MPRSWKVLLKVYVHPYREHADQTMTRSGDNFFVAAREVELPFHPRPGLELSRAFAWAGGRPAEPDEPAEDGFMVDSADEAQLRVKRVVWDFEGGRWVVIADALIGCFHEETEETLERRHPGWKFKYYPEHWDGLAGEPAD